MPVVSVIVPCLNEATSITKLLDGIKGQSFLTRDLEIIISDGLSQDGTREIIAQYRQAHPEMNIKVIDNPIRTIPAGLNLAIKAATGQYIIRLDAHSVPNPEYIRLCVDTLAAGKADNVGGIWIVKPGDDSWMARSIAQAGSHPLGVGDARYRYTKTAGYVETVPFGAYKRELFDRIGFYNETLFSNEDYELNTRILKADGKIWLDPAIQSEYYARRTFSALTRQYWRYGNWKAQMLILYPKTIRLRQVLPPLFVLGIILLALLAIINDLFTGIFLGILVLYFGILFSTSLVIALQKRYLPFIIGVPIAVSIMHICWGSGLLWSLINPPAAYSAS
jgi:succinoglycan biosynthesis protein ExoA